MKAYRIWLPLFLATLGVAFNASSSVMAQEHHHSAEHQHAMEHHQEFKVGNKGVITVPVPTMIGGQVLEPGRYKFRHREGNGAHFVRFQQVGSRAETGEFLCELEPLERKAKNTSLFTDTSVNPPRIVKVIVRGENVAHVF